MYMEYLFVYPKIDFVELYAYHRSKLLYYRPRTILGVQFAREFLFLVSTTATLYLLHHANVVSISINVF